MLVLGTNWQEWYELCQRERRGKRVMSVLEVHVSVKAKEGDRRVAREREK